jgi:putative NADH-flavin reductase
MKILLLGASGAIGKEFLTITLEKGDEVYAYIRRENALEGFNQKNLKRVIGELDNQELLADLISKVDLTISALGPHMDMSRKVKSTPIADVHQFVADYLKDKAKNRFITMGTITVKSLTDKRHFKNRFLPIIAKVLFPTGYVEYRRMGDILNESGIDWTVVRFLDPKAKHIETDLEVVMNGIPKRMGISRKNIAKFMYKVAKENLYIREMPMIYH